MQEGHLILQSTPSRNSLLTKLASDLLSQAALALQTTGALVLRTSSVSPTSNAEFLDLFEDYFDQDREKLKKDERPEFGYQVSIRA